jgi:hypothetical protein
MILSWELNTLLIWEPTFIQTASLVRNGSDDAVQHSELPVSLTLYIDRDMKGVSEKFKRMGNDRTSG